MELEPLNEGNIILNGHSYRFKTFMPKTSAKTNGLWRLLRINDIKGNEIVTIYNVLKDNLRYIIIKSLRDMNMLPK